MLSLTSSQHNKGTMFINITLWPLTEILVGTKNEFLNELLLQILMKYEKVVSNEMYVCTLKISTYVIKGLK
jgi:hypothetical protein